MVWEDLLLEVRNKDKENQQFYGTNLNLRRDREKRLQAKANPKPKRESKKYRLGGKFEHVYFTPREAQCMILLLKGQTINSVAEELLLSPRTVEFYVKNMKAKLQCRTKFELVSVVHNSEFLKNYNP